MIEIRLHGRGGQGVKKAAQILGRAGFLAGYYVQDFALYGAERKGAPLTSFVRLSKIPIRTRGHIFHPDYIIILDDTVDLRCDLTGSKPTTKVLINTAKGFKEYKNMHKVDATEIALRLIGKPVANVVLLGAFAKITKLFTLKQIDKAVRIELGKYPAAVLDKNVRGANEAYKKVK
ncbi:2-oxoacid:acceptor oxidoreductase family protein [Candidatus Woesearchaeota archaeon]|nr:2-oxoacid:acceptor oxidoreductase family protein [Candidatus Woesearchaeota archaeon]MBW3021648.1 2-oxoacid:acceptor oxidoreductase family protein [Candidatus Woesearchaeota archaeon]